MRKYSIPDLVSQHPHNVHLQCVESRAAAFAHGNFGQWEAAVRRTAAQYHASILETANLVCGPTLCPCIVEGGDVVPGLVNGSPVPAPAPVLMMWDSNHLTIEHIAENLAPVVSLDLEINWLFTNTSV